MLYDNEHFNINYLGYTAFVTEHTIGDTQVFRINFTDGKEPLTITRSSTAAGKLWMSVPQGRQKLAEEVGVLISEHFKSM